MERAVQPASGGQTANRAGVLPAGGPGVAPQDPVEAEARLARAVEGADEAFVARELADIGRASIEFSGRCFALAITRGLVETSLLFGRVGFHLNVMDEPAVRAELASGCAQTRGLLEFMRRYRGCRAQRTYYLPIVQEERSLEPIRALLAQGEGLTARDCSELLSLALRQDKVELARVLVQGGARLPDDIHDAAPRDLAGKMSVPACASPWVEQLSPRCSMQTIGFVLEQLQGAPCPVRADWFKLYFRDPLFSDKLALIALQANAELCEDAAALLAELARGGHMQALRSVLAWDGLRAEDLDEALRIAREAGQVEMSAALLQARRARAKPLEALSF